jgi:nucleolar MIF4G domain-containing protein 1
MISNRSNLLDSFVILYATLVGALHRVVGMEFGQLSSSLQLV